MEAALEADDVPLFSVLYLHGPGGIGKSSLLEVFAEIARSKGADVLSVDGRFLEPTRTAAEEPSSEFCTVRTSDAWARPASSS